MIGVALAFLVAAGGGALARAVLGRHLNRAWPWGTWVVNVTGSLTLGLLAHGSAFVATVLGTGLLGAYTTFSSFARDVVALWEREQRLGAIVYVVTSVAVCVAAAWLGLAIVE